MYLIQKKDHIHLNLYMLNGRTTSGTLTANCFVSWGTVLECISKAQ